jgi:phosphonoacetaldehyde hydrolase
LEEEIMKPIIQRHRYGGPIKAVILDWAGTTVDYGCMGPVAAFLEVFKRHDVEVTVGEARAPMGMMKKDHLRLMCHMESISLKWKERFGRPPTEQDVDMMYSELEPMMVSSIAAYSDLIPGVLETIAELRSRGIKIGSTTGYSRPIMEILTKEAARSGYQPDAVVCPTDVPAGRPYPYMCYQNAIRLEVYPLEAVVKIGDTVVDIEEGLNAGMWTLGVTKTSSELGLPEKDVAKMDQETLKYKLAGVRKKFLGAGCYEVVEGIYDCVRIIDEINERLAKGEAP